MTALQPFHLKKQQNRFLLLHCKFPIFGQPLKSHVLCINFISDPECSVVSSGLDSFENYESLTLHFSKVVSSKLSDFL